MNEIKLFKDEAMAGKSIEDQMQLFGSMCCLLAVAVSEEEAKNAWAHMMDAAELSELANCPLFDELYGATTKHLLAKFDRVDQTGLVSHIKRLMEVFKNG